jgi:hypothetical protein
VVIVPPLLYDPDASYFTNRGAVPVAGSTVNDADGRGPVLISSTIDVDVTGGGAVVGVVTMTRVVTMDPG